MHTIWRPGARLESCVCVCVCVCVCEYVQCGCVCGCVCVKTQPCFASSLPTAISSHIYESQTTYTSHKYVHESRNMYTSHELRIRVTNCRWDLSHVVSAHKRVVNYRVRPRETSFGRLLFFTVTNYVYDSRTVSDTWAMSAALIRG